MKPILFSLLMAISVLACCPSKMCMDGLVKVIPYYDGRYTLPSLPHKYYVLAETKPEHPFPVVRFGRDNLNCTSDVSFADLKCCKAYKFKLFASFNGVIPDKLLDSTTVKITGEDDCFIFDVDPNHNN